MPPLKAKENDDIFRRVVNQGSTYCELVWHGTLGISSLNSLDNLVCAEHGTFAY